MKKPVSPKRLAANRANAARSTGPRSAEGKARSAQNSRKHGFTASVFAVVRLEELDEVARLREDLIACYQPVNSQELFAIERIALAQQSLLRTCAVPFGIRSSPVIAKCYAPRSLPVSLTDEISTRRPNRSPGRSARFSFLIQREQRKSRQICGMSVLWSPFVPSRYIRCRNVSKWKRCSSLIG